MKLLHPQKRLGPRGFLACTLAVNMLVIMAIDMYAPALPGMTQELGVSPSVLNLTMFAFFFMSALGVFVAGPLSDRIGRRPVMLGASVLFTLGSLGCAFTGGIAGLVFFRVLQALAYGAVTAVESALVKDAFAGRDLQLAMTLVQSLIVVGPVIAPFLGTFLLSVGGWREIFLVLAAFGAACIVCSLLISETLVPENRMQGGVLATLGHTARSFGGFLGERRFVTLALVMALASIPYTAFLATVSYIVLDEFAQDYLVYCIVYAVVALTSVAAPFLYIALSRRLSILQVLVLSLALCAVSAAAMLPLGAVSAFWFTAAFVPFVLAEGIIRPMAFMVLLDQPPERVGAASSLVNLMYSIFSSVGTVLGTLGWSSYILGLGAILAVTTALMVALSALYAKARREG